MLKISPGGIYMKRFSGSLITAALTLAASGLAAQNALEEVIVTAQKREQSLQDIPVAITAFSEADIACTITVAD